MRDVFDIIKNHCGKRFIYGTGDGADKLLDYLDSIGVEIDGVCVSDEFYRERIFRNMKVFPISALSEKYEDAMFLMAFGTKNTEDIFSLNKKINLVYPEMPVVGNIPFTKDVLEKDKEKISNAFSLFSDDESKTVFENVIKFRLSGNISYLKECESSVEDGYGLILKKDKKEIVFDCGAYTGDTAEDFEKYSGGLEHFYGAEPCPKSFSKLKAKYGRFDLFNCAIGKDDGEADFVFSRGRGSTVYNAPSLSTGKIKKVPVKTVDGILQGKFCSIIKYDVEGFEENALLGSTETIKMHNPNLLVAAYHKAKDIYELPLLINSIYDGYEIFLRHHPCLPAWETNIYARSKK